MMRRALERDRETAAVRFRRLGSEYERDAFGSRGQLEVSGRELAAVHAALSDLPSRARVLDAGAGNGRFTRPLRSRGFDVTALDAEPAMLRSVSVNLPGTSTVLARLGEPLPFEDGSFDAVVAIRVLKWVPAWRYALHELARVVRPDGLAVVEFANRRSFARFGYRDAVVGLVTPAQVDAAGHDAGIEWTATSAGTHLPFPCWQRATTPRRVAAARAAQQMCEKALGAHGARSIIRVGRVRGRHGDQG